jgi:hypothetical protein
MGTLMKQTAVEWLQERLNPDMKTMQGVIIQELIEQAKAMETDQLTEAYEDGYEAAIYNKSFDCES